MTLFRAACTAATLPVDSEPWRGGSARQGDAWGMGFLVGEPLSNVDDRGSEMRCVWQEAKDGISDDGCVIHIERGLLKHMEDGGRVAISQRSKGSHI